MTPQATSWYEANQRYLMAAVALVREALERHAARPKRVPKPEPPSAAARKALAEAAAELPGASALDVLCDTLGLSDFDRDVLVMCAAMELEGDFGALCGKAAGSADLGYPTFGLALAALPGATWSTLSPGAPLRRWLLVEIGPGNAVTSAPLRIDEPILHFLTGVPSPDERLAGISEPLAAAGELVPSHLELCEELQKVWRRTAGTAEFPVIQLCGGEIAGKRSIAAEVCRRLDLRPARAPAAALPTAPAELLKLVRLFSRQALLEGGSLVLDCDEVDPGDAARDHAIHEVIDSYRGPLIVTVRKRRPTRDRPILTRDVEKPRRQEQRRLWQALLGREDDDTDPLVQRLVSQFDLSAPTIRAAWAGAQGRVDEGAEAEAPGTDELADSLWTSSRDQARPSLDDLAQRIERRATRDQLVLPPAALETLHEIVAHVRYQATVYETWGFRDLSARGLGISALFSGASGTGKTMAAEVVARELDLDLYRIDLSSVVSKYIGETEKNLARVFDAAEEGGSILLFDEADALFGKRSEIRDSHDRYANVEISYLLQRMESYRGLAILTTNMREALDQAFLRRIRFILDFPFPDLAERAEIWKQIFPPRTPTEDLDVGKLARLSVAGGSIRNIALNAAFLAAEEGSAVGMKHLLRAARSEFQKVRKPLAESEVRDWVQQ